MGTQILVALAYTLAAMLVLLVILALYGLWAMLLGVATLVAALFIAIAQ